MRTLLCLLFPLGFCLASLGLSTDSHRTVWRCDVSPHQWQSLGPAAPCSPQTSSSSGRHSPPPGCLAASAGRSSWSSPCGDRGQPGRSSSPKRLSDRSGLESVLPCCSRRSDLTSTSPPPAQSSRTSPCCISAGREYADWSCLNTTVSISKKDFVLRI